MRYYLKFISMVASSNWLSVNGKWTRVLSVGPVSPLDGKAALENDRQKLILIIPGN